VIAITALAIGVFIAATALTLLLFQYFSTHLGGVPLNTIKNINIKPQGDKSVYIGGLIGLIVGLFLFWGSKRILQILLFFALVGAGVGYLKNKLEDQEILHRKKQEISILFENIEILMRAGLPLQKALLETKDLLVVLRPAIERSMAHWPNTSLILETLRKEVNLPEGDILVSLLSQLNIAGIDKFDGVIQRESQRLEELRAAAERVRIAKKPYWLVFSRTLPVIVIFGMFIGALFIRMREIMPFGLL